MDDDDHWKHWRQQRADKILDVVLKDKPALMDHEHEESQPDTLQARWIANEARRLKRKRRHELIYTLFFYAVCIIAVAVFVVCVLGAVR